MKFLIIAHSRSGSQNLMNALGQVVKAPVICEPWNSSIERIEDAQLDLSVDKLVVKTLGNQVPNEKQAPIDFYLKFAKNFDTVILLARRDKKSSYESFTHSAKTQIWHKSWEWMEGTEISETAIRVIDQSQDIIDSLSKKMKLQITWYEDLYSNNEELFLQVTSHWGIDGEALFPYFDPKNRLRAPSSCTDKA